MPKSRTRRPSFIPSTPDDGINPDETQSMFILMIQEKSKKLH